MKIEETERQRRLLKLQNALLFTGLALLIYVVGFPWIIMAIIQNDGLTNSIHMGPKWFLNLVTVIVYPLFMLYSEIEVYETYVDWIIEVVGP